MKVKQISVFLENRSGHLFAITNALKNANVNIRALALADTSDFGIARIIVNDYEKALAALKDAGYIARTTDVLALAIPDVPGGLSSVLEVVSNAGLDVEYMYAFVGRTPSHAVMIFRFEDIDTAIELLKEKENVRIYRADEAYSF